MNSYFLMCFPRLPRMMVRVSKVEGELRTKIEPTLW